MEAREAVSGKDFAHRIRISCKEARETRYWLQLVMPRSEEEIKRNELVQEATELLKILSVIKAKVEAKSATK
jgi:four helix bundle protein